MPESSKRFCRLYHFLTTKWALDDISRKRLKISKFEDLNDPFELLGARVPDEQLNALLIEDFKKSRGLICCSEKWSNPLMWSHYAEKHAGICFGIDVPEDQLWPVDYVKNPVVAATGELLQQLVTRLSAPPRLTMQDPVVAQFEPVMRSLLSTKMHGWSYEEEVRVITSLQKEENGLYFKYFDDVFLLREVILGIKCVASVAYIAEILQTYDNPVRIVRARKKPNSFDIVGPDGVTPG